MSVMNIIQAVHSALDSELARDPDVVVFGEDVGRFGGVFRATDGLQAKYGEDRVFDTPLSEAGIVGTAIGMAAYGMRPVPEIQFADFIYPAFDQIVNEMAKMRYRSGGRIGQPVTIRTPVGGGIRGGHYHSQSPEAYFAHTPGLKVVCPSNPYDAKGLLISAIRDDDPVLFLEPKRVYRAARGEVPDEPYTLPLGKAARVAEGEHVTVLTYGATVHEALKAAEIARGEGLALDVLDLRSLVPLDEEAILESVARTGRVVIVHEAPRNCGFGAELAARIAEKALLHLECPIERVAGFDTPFPYTLEMDYLPDAKRIVAAARRAFSY
ncbi:alpha-ketoacid dehydrogenase subunit beta [Myxococcota bacterium]|nr:alpha-ketoacid dehydrogenase subunit beta [Myxococcota bacterium]